MKANFLLPFTSASTITKFSLTEEERCAFLWNDRKKVLHAVETKTTTWVHRNLVTFAGFGIVKCEFCLRVVVVSCHLWWEKKCVANDTLRNGSCVRRVMLCYVTLLFLCKCNQELAYFATRGLNIFLFEESLFNSRQRQMPFLFSKAPRQAMGSAQPPV
jgi:hypothetical protein